MKKKRKFKIYAHKNSKGLSKIIYLCYINSVDILMILRAATLRTNVTPEWNSTQVIEYDSGIHLT